MALDLNIGYYTISLDPDASKICTIIFPWGKYSYKRLPMGIAGSPNIFQEKNVRLNGHPQVHLNVFGWSFDHHKREPGRPSWNLSMVLTRLHDTGLKIDANESKFCALETEYLGYILTRNGIKPQSNKVQAMLALACPERSKNSTGFWGWFSFIETSGQGAATCLPRLKSQKPKEPKRSPGTGLKSIKKHLMM